MTDRSAAALIVDAAIVAWHIDRPRDGLTEAWNNTDQPIHPDEECHPVNDQPHHAAARTRTPDEDDAAVQAVEWRRKVLARLAPKGLSAEATTRAERTVEHLRDAR